MKDPNRSGRRRATRTNSLVRPINRRAAAFLWVVFGVAILFAWQLFKSKTRPPARPTFTRDIAPILWANCAGCHRPGQAAPFALLTYRDAKKRARDIADMTARRRMPPWLPEAGYGEFSDVRRLTAEQIDCIQRWTAAGAPEGNPRDLPAPPFWSDGWQLGRPDLVVEMEQPYTVPAEGKNLYRNFVIPVPLETDRFIRAVEIDPGNRRVVHHAFLKIDPTPESRRLDRADAEPGFPFMLTPDSAQIPEGHFLSWTPGAASRPNPLGLAWKLTPGSDVVLQVHMNPSGRPESLRAKVAFYFADRPPQVSPFKLLLTSRSIDIPSGEKYFVVEDRMNMPADADLLAILPHAHLLAKEMQTFALLPDGSKRWLLWIKQWDFNWQGDYRYARPVTLPKGSQIVMRFTYDNSAENPRNPNHPPKEVTYGPDASDEMAELWLQIVPRATSDLSLFSRAARDKAALVWENQYSNRLKKNPSDQEAHLGRAKALLAQGRAVDAEAELRSVLALQPKSEEAHFYLGYVLRQQQRLNEARAEYESVLALNPKNFEAHGNLGRIFLEQTNLEAAAAAFSAALEINPKDKIALRNIEFIQRIRAGLSE